MSKEYYVVLHGAKKNVGDFLIRERAKKLLRFLRNDRELIEFPSWESLDKKLDVINNAKAIVIMGGPAISAKVYPNVFPLTKNLDDIKVPIYIMGSGSYVYPVSYVNNYKITNQSIHFLTKCKRISVRDITTKNILENNGLKNVIMSGCPAWYDIDKFSQVFIRKTNIETIVLSTPQKKVYFPQFIELVHKVKKEFKNSELIITFNRGYKEDKYTNKRESSYMKDYYNILKDMNLKIVDLSSDLETFLKHLNYDLHIGYRLHTHINFISNRKPSYLLSEDSRSYGHCKTLSLSVFEANRESLLEKTLPMLNEGFLKRVIMHFLPFIQLNESVIDELISFIKYDIDTNFSSFYGLEDKLSENFKSMESFIKELP